MVRIPGASALGPASGLPPVEIGAFWIDRYEVTNRQFKAFVDAGGYATEKWWKVPFVRGQHRLSWAEAMQLFRDANGRPGPAKWKNGSYAEGEAELGWLNASAHLSADQPFDIDPLLMAVIEDLRLSLAKLGGEVAHLKVIGLEEGGAFGVANLVSSATGSELSLPSNTKAREADLIVNARVAVDPGELEREVRRVVQQAADAVGVTVEFRQSQSLRPGRPTPTHRYAKASGAP